ncbi:MAG: chemotaxis protein CheW [Zetaproteobacteria bacterium]|nr:chemotaxis protein CheW [Zetaproteobacteria bacterium]
MSKSKYKVLMIDDEQDILELMLEEMEGEMDHEIITAQTVKAACDMIVKHHSSLILVVSDFCLDQGKDGFEVREFMLEHGFTDIPFCVLSGNITKEIALQGLRYKICDFIDKPVEDYSGFVESLRSFSKDRVEVLEFESETRKVYFQEAMEILEDLEPAVLDLETDPGNEDLINRIFRGVHTLKGGSHVLACHEITEFMHHLEDLLNQLRNRVMSVSAGLINVLLAGLDQIAQMIQSIRNEEPQQWVMEDLLRILELDVKSRGSAPVELIHKSRPSQPSKKSSSLKVPVELLDKLMGYCGELTVYKNMSTKLVTVIKQLLPLNKDIALLEDILTEMSELQNSIQIQVTELRKVSLSIIFKPIVRVVRDLNVSLGKQAFISTQGDELRVDTHISQILSNSLIHMIRNCMDHGIETPEVRKSLGKPVEGSIVLSGSEQGENIVITIEDDGAGLNRERIIQKAYENGLFTLDQLQQMSDRKVYGLIFAPGFSTAEAVTEVSGRGVGMDMVAASIQSIRGRIDIESELGVGTKFRLILPKPKSVEILESLMVSSQGQLFAIPHHSLVRLVRTGEGSRAKVVPMEGGELLVLDDELIPIVSLCRILWGNEAAGDSVKGDILVCRSQGKKLAILVDSIQDSESIVVKNLLPLISHQGVFDGSAILGDGSIGLIVSVDGLAQQYLYKDEVHEGLEDDHLDSAGMADTEWNADHHILVKLPFEGAFTFPLSKVFRLEEVSARDVQHSGSSKAVIYRDGVMPILNILEDFEGSTRPLPGEEREILHLIVIRQPGDNYVGLQVEEILDIVDVPQQLDKTLNQDRHFLGSFVEGPCTYTVLDADYILREMGIETLTGNSPHKENKQGRRRRSLREERVPERTDESPAPAAVEAATPNVESAPSGDGVAWQLF